MIDTVELKKDFPIFNRVINGNSLTYLDSGATSQKPIQVLNKMNEIYEHFRRAMFLGDLPRGTD